MTTTPLSPSQIQSWLSDTPAPVQAAFEALATMQLLQEVTDNAEAVLKLADSLGDQPEQIAGAYALTRATMTRMVEVSRRQVDTLRALLQV